jgi:predicted GNAT family acetyltransferase
MDHTLALRYGDFVWAVCTVDGCAGEWPPEGRAMPKEPADEVVEFIDRPEQARFVVTVNGEIAGFATYRLRDDLITFIHTEVDAAFGGHGLGTRLVVHALDDARRRGLRVRPLCPLFAKFISEHTEYQELLAAAAP